MNRLVTILKTLLWGIVGIILGIILRRFLLNPGIAPAQSDLVPAWIGFVFVLAIAVVIIYALTLFLGGIKDSEEKLFQPATMKMLLPEIMTFPRRYTLALIVTAAITFAFIPGSLLVASQQESKAVSAARHIGGFLLKDSQSGKHFYSLAKEEEIQYERVDPVKLMVIDGNRNGKLVFFPHDDHTDIIGEEDACGSCHHLNMPFDQNSSCFECHRKMDAPTDIFSHSSHISKLGENKACRECHKNKEQVKSRSTATACLDCHQGMAIKDSFIGLSDNGIKGIAAGYKKAMHGLCVNCHEDSDPDLADCTICHQDSNDAIPFNRMNPYSSTPK